MFLDVTEDLKHVLTVVTTENKFYFKLDVHFFPIKLFKLHFDHMYQTKGGFKEIILWIIEKCFPLFHL